MKHLYLPATFVEPTGEALRHIIDVREDAWLSSIEDGDYSFSAVKVGTAWVSNAIVVNGLVVCPTFQALQILAGKIGGRLPTIGEVVLALKEQQYFEPIKVTFPKGHSLAFQTSASNEAVKMHSDAILAQRKATNNAYNANEGKFWTPECVNIGWADPRGPYTIGPGIKGWQPAGRKHNKFHTDCAQTARVAFDQDPDTIDLSPITSSHPNAWRVPDQTLGARTCGWMGRQFGDKVAEYTGDRHNRTILSYSENCRRGGTFVGMAEDGSPIWDGGFSLRLYRDEDPWCAATASKSLEVSLYPGESPPHGLRVSVRELCEDGRVFGTLRTIEEYPDYIPQPGDLAIYKRSGENPLYGGRGHVAVVIVTMLSEDKFRAIGGNESNKVSLKDRPLRHRDLVAFICRTQVK